MDFLTNGGADNPSRIPSPFRWSGGREAAVLDSHDSASGRADPYNFKRRHQRSLGAFAFAFSGHHFFVVSLDPSID